MKIKFIILFALALGLVACENQENEFDDFGSESVFFPFQTPARSLIQGKSDLGFNDNDNAGRFEIGIRMSGVRENNENRSVSYEVAPDLIDVASLNQIDPTRVTFNSVNVQLLPASYYTIEQESPVTIPSGSTTGIIPIQLTDAFFDDPLSIAPSDSINYVIPLRITNFEGLDSLLTGVPAVENPIKIKADDWDTQPKDYTLFGIKFINKYHGTHLRRGEDKVVGNSTKLTISTGVSEPTAIDTTVVYRADFVVEDEITLVTTAGRNKANVSNLIRRGDIATSQTVSLEMTFDENENIAIGPVEGGNQTVIGTGRWLEDGDEWGGKRRDVIYLEYQYQDTETFEEVFFGSVISRTTLDLMHTVKDTLVIRDRDVRFEQFTVELEEQ